MAVESALSDPALDPLRDAAEVRAHQWRLLIGGELVEPRSGRSADSIDPATEQTAARFPDGGSADVDAAVQAARRACPSWRRMAARERGRLVRGLAEIILRHEDELAFLDALDGGFPVTSMHNDVHWAAELLELFADWAIELKGETVPASAEHLHYTLREPFGTVGRIVPYNHPLFFAAGKIAAPLVAGNAVVLKPADQTPLSALRMGELFRDALPPGVLNIVTGIGPEAGSALVAHPDVHRLAFIGSEAVGRAIQRDAAAAAVKTVSLELGGKNAMVVFPDADLERVAQGVVAGMNFIGSQGQSCGSNSRVLVHVDVADEVVERVAATVEDIRIGSPLDPATQMGPLISQQHLERVQAYIAAGREQGAALVTGGGRPNTLDRGYFLQPTVFTGVQPDMRIAREEIFGPVLSIMTWRDRDEAVALANGVDFGLTASVWTSDVKCAHSVARDLEAGYVWINGSSRHFWGLPFGGVKASGVGREESLEELLSFTQTKTVNVVLD
jgi:2-formylbenzoate dehydrogenase